MVQPFIGVYTRVWDEADYVIPPAENGAFFIATNAIISPNQTRGEAANVRRLTNLKSDFVATFCKLLSGTE